MKKAVNYLVILLLLGIASRPLNGQTEGVSIKTTVGPPHASAMLDVESGTKGVLVPRVFLTRDTLAAPVTNPADGLIVYNTNDTLNPWGKGLYYWRIDPDDANEKKWIKITQGNGPAKVTFEQMMGLTPYLNMHDLGMMVFVTNSDPVLLYENSDVSATEIINYFPISETHRGSGLRKYRHVFGLWVFTRKPGVCWSPADYVWVYVDYSRFGPTASGVGHPNSSLTVSGIPSCD